MGMVVYPQVRDGGEHPTTMKFEDCALDHPCDQHSHCNYCGNGLATGHENYFKLCYQHQDQAQKDYFKPQDQG